jgi:hypothetical protein
MASNETERGYEDCGGVDYWLTTVMPTVWLGNERATSLDAEVTKTPSPSITVTTHHRNSLFIKAIGFTNLRQSRCIPQMLPLCPRSCTLHRSLLGKSLVKNAEE